MLMIPFPFVLAEIILFFAAVQHWGFWNTLGLYFLPCILGYFIVSVVGQVTLVSLQASVAKGQLPGTKLLNSGAIFVAGILMLIPSFFSRVLSVVLLTPGLRHLVLWKFKTYLVNKMSSGSSFGFRYYGFGKQSTDGFKDVHSEREVREASVLDVTPIEITHEPVKNTDGKDS